MSSRRHPAWAAFAGIVAACGHAPAVPPRPISPVLWPEPPSPPRARLVAIVPDPDAPAPSRPWWTIAAEWITGGKLAPSAREALQRPFGVAIGPDGAVYVADPDSGGVYRVRPDGSLSTVRCRATDWGAPMAVAFAGGALYVADAALAAVARIEAGRCALLGKGAFQRPTGLAVGGGRVFVADPPMHRIVVLEDDGRVVARWGGQGSGDGELAFPTSVAFAANGDLLVADALNFRVARIDAGGRWVSAFGSPGDTGAGFARPKGIAVDGAGLVYVSDAQRDMVLVFAESGALQYAIGAPGDGPGRFELPSGLAVAAGRLYVADSQNRRIQVFELVGGRP